jgi:D-serine deaminase-like pyridoxal phosphate-dependent protein
VIGEKGSLQRRLGRVRLHPLRDAAKTYKVGDRLELIVPHCDPAVNEYDVIHGTRKDRVEVVWPISARGHSQ